MMQKIVKITMLLFLALGQVACAPEDTKESGKEILKVTVSEDPEAYVVIEGTEVKLYVDDELDLTQLTPIFTLSEGATISPNTGATANLKVSQPYIVAAADASTEVYLVQAFKRGTSLINVSFAEVEVLENTVINGHYISKVPFQNDYQLTAMTLQLEVADGSTILTDLTQALNMEEGVEVQVQSLSGEVVSHTVKAEYGGSDANQLDEVVLSSHYTSASNEDNIFNISLPYGTDITALVIEAILPQYAVVDIAFGEARDYSSPIDYTVTSQDGNSAVYTVNITVGKQETSVRAVWIPDPSHSTAMRTYDNVKNTIALLDELNFNTIYVATYVRAQTAWKSQTLVDNTTYTTKEEGWLFKDYAYTSTTNDPLQDLIDEAHKVGIKVIFWFEYGFMINYGSPADNHPILATHPEWMGYGYDGEYSNYNGTDYYLASYNPEVQQFLLDMIVESMTLYPDVDGIQGDDRMPAAPANSGYDDYTVNRYKAEHDGAEPPENYNAGDWKQWRMDILNEFAKTLHATVKAQNPDAKMCFSPNPYPWCETNLMQQWPTWLEDDVVDILSVQCYRTDIASYTWTVKEVLGHAAVSSTMRVNPGMKLKIGGDYLSEEELSEQLKVNRELGTLGESQFYFDGLYKDYVQKVFKVFYPAKALFPEE